MVSLRMDHNGLQDCEGSDGKKSDRRWFAGLYFALRFAVFAVFAFTTNHFMQLAFQQYLLLLCNIVLDFSPIQEGFLQQSRCLHVCSIDSPEYIYNVQFLYTSMKQSKPVFIFQFLLIFGYIFHFFIVYRWGKKRLRRPNVHRGRVHIVHEDGNTDTDKTFLKQLMRGDHTMIMEQFSPCMTMPSAQ